MLQVPAGAFGRACRLHAINGTSELPPSRMPPALVAPDVWASAVRRSRHRVRPTNRSNVGRDLTMGAVRAAAKLHICRLWARQAPNTALLQCTLCLPSLSFTGRLPPSQRLLPIIHSAPSLPPSFTGGLRPLACHSMASHHQAQTAAGGGR